MSETCSKCNREMVSIRYGVYKCRGCGLCIEYGCDPRPKPAKPTEKEIKAALDYWMPNRGLDRERARALVDSAITELVELRAAADVLLKDCKNLLKDTYCYNRLKKAMGGGE